MSSCATTAPRLMLIRSRTERAVKTRNNDFLRITVSPSSNLSLIDASCEQTHYTIPWLAHLLITDRGCHPWIYVCPPGRGILVTAVWLHNAVPPIRKYARRQR